MQLFWCNSDVILLLFWCNSGVALMRCSTVLVYFYYHFSALLVQICWNFDWFFVLVNIEISFRRFTSLVISLLFSFCLSNEGIKFMELRMNTI